MSDLTDSVDAEKPPAPTAYVSATSAVVIVSTPPDSECENGGTVRLRLSTASVARSSKRPATRACSMRISRGVSTVKRAMLSDATTTACEFAIGSYGPPTMGAYVGVGSRTRAADAAPTAAAVASSARERMVRCGSSVGARRSGVDVG